MHTQVNPDHSVTFRLYAPRAHQVEVAGNFSLWEQVSLEPKGQGLWELTTQSLGSRDIIYKFVIDGTYAKDPRVLRTDKTSDDNSLLSTSGEKGTLLHDSLYSNALGREMNYVVYLPPSYFLTNDKYPVLYLMCGLLDYELSWATKGNLAEISDELVSDNRTQEMVIVMPDKHEAWTSQNDQHRFHEYMTNDVIPQITQRYKVWQGFGGQAIEGLSIGAHWAYKIACNNPYQFASVSLLSCPISEELYSLTRESLNHLKNSGLRVRVNCGDGEQELIPECDRFSNFLNELEVPCEFYVGEGPHDWPLWQREIYNSLQFHSSSFKAM